MGEDAEVAAGADEDLFEKADEVYWAEMRAFLAGEIATKVNDWVADELTWTVIGDVAAAIDLVEFHAALSEEFVGGEDV